MTKEMTIREAIRSALYEELSQNDDVVLIGEDIGQFGGSFDVTKGLLDFFGSDRVIDTPIAENGFTGMAVGAAMSGMRPVVEIMFSDFIAYAMDAIVNQAAKQHFVTGGQVKVPLVIRTPGGAGTQAAAQHSQSLEAWFCHVPGLLVLSPSTPHDAKGLLKAAIRHDGPVLFFEHKLAYDTKGEVPEKEYTLPIGKARIARAGQDVTLVSYSYTVHKCLDAAEQLAAQGIEAEVIDLRSLYPLDMECIFRSVKKTRRLLVAHEAVQKFGVGAEIAAQVAESTVIHSLLCPIARVCGADMPIAFNKQIECQSIPQADQIEQKVLQMLDS